MVLISAMELSAAAGPEGRFPIREGRKFGFISRAGKVVIPPQYDSVGPFREGLARVIVGNLTGYIDFDGRIVVKPQYGNGTDFQKGRAVVRLDDAYIVIDREGAVVNKVPYRPLGDYHQDLLVVIKYKPTAYGFIDRDGKVVIEPHFLPSSAFPDDGGLAKGGENREWCYFDKTGKVIIRVPFGERPEDAAMFKEGLLRMKEGFYWGYKGIDGKWHLPPKYDAAEDFEEGMARVEEQGKWKIINREGKEINPKDLPKIRPVAPMAEGLRLATDGSRMGWVDSQGKPAFALRVYGKAYSFSSGRARIQLDQLYGYLDKTGNLIIPNRFSTAADFEDGLAWVMDKDGTMGYIDTPGAFVWKMAGR